MTDINQLATATAFSAGMKFPVYDPANGQPRKVSGQQIIDVVAVGAQAVVTGLNNRFYPGTYAADPTTRPDGSPVQSGDRYFNSAIARQKTFSGSIWSTDNLDSAALALSTGSSLLGWLQAGTGGVARTSQDKLRELVSVKDFGCLGDGATDDAANFQKAINYAQSVNALLYIPQGSYLIGTALSVTGNLTMYGAGSNGSILRTVTNTQDLISVDTGNWKVTFRDFMLVGKTTATAGALVKLTGSTGNLFASFDGVRFQDGWDQLFTISAGSWMAEKCLFISPNNTGATIQNQVNLDGGDMGIVNSTFLGKSVGTAVLQFSAGGLRFIGNKVIAWANGYKLDMVAGTATADLFIIGNSFESFTDTAIAMLKDAGSSFVAAHISDNEIAGVPNGINISGTGTWLTHLTITENDVLVNSNGKCVSITGANSFTVADNKLDSGGGTSIGLAITVGNTNGNIHDNRFHTLGTAISGVGTGTNIVIHDNPGYNPVGAAAVTPGVSPYTYTNGPSPATLYIAASTSITAITVGGVSILPAATAANANMTLELGPNEATVITYTGTLTAKNMVH